MQYLLILGKTVRINVNIGLTLEYRYLDLTCLKCIVWLTGRKDSKLSWWACSMVIYSGSWTNTQFWGGGVLSYIGCVNVACWVYDYKCSTYTTWGTSRHNSGLWGMYYQTWYFLYYTDWWWMEHKLLVWKVIHVLPFYSSLLFFVLYHYTVKPYYPFYLTYNSHRL